MVFVDHAGPGTWLGGLDAGVLVFFTLSGYLLYRPFLEQRVDLWGYAVRRLFRIAPAYLVASFAIGWLYGVPLDLWGILTMEHTPVIVAWTLQIEVVFYAALPLIAFVARGRRSILWLVAAASLAAGGTTLALTRVVPLGFIAWAWAFVPGMVLAQLTRRRQLPAGSALAVAGMALLATSILPNIAYPDVPAAAGSALVVAWLLTLPKPGPRLGRGLAVAGALSYSFYLWHEAVRDLVGPATYTNAVVALLLTTAVSAAVYATIELPALRLGREIAAAPLWRAWPHRQPTTSD